MEPRDGPHARQLATSVGTIEAVITSNSSNPISASLGVEDVRATWHLPRLITFCWIRYIGTTSTCVHNHFACIYVSSGHFCHTNLPSVFGGLLDDLTSIQRSATSPCLRVRFSVRSHHVAK